MTPLLTIKDLCDWLNIKPHTVSRMVAAGAIPYVLLRAGKRKKLVRFRAEDVERWLENRTVAAVRGPGRGGRRSRPANGNDVATPGAASPQAFEVQRENGGRR